MIAAAHLNNRPIGFMHLSDLPEKYNDSKSYYCHYIIDFPWIYLSLENHNVQNVIFLGTYEPVEFYRKVTIIET